MKIKNLIIFILLSSITIGSYIIYIKIKPINSMMNDIVVTTVSTENSEELVFEGSDKEYIKKECKESEDGQHKACIIIQNNKYYLIYDSNKSKAYDNIIELDYDIYSDVFYFKGIKNNKINELCINCFVTNDDHDIFGESIPDSQRNKLILSPNLKIEVKINGTECGGRYRYKGDIKNAYSEETVSCDRNEVFRNGEPIGIYSQIDELIFSPDSQKLAFIVRNNCKSRGDNWWSCESSQVVVNGVKSEEYEGGVYDLVFSNDSNNLAYRIYDDGNFRIVYNNIKKESYDYILSKSLKFDPITNKFSYIGAKNCLENYCSGTGAGGGSSIDCNDYYVVLDNQKPVRINGGRFMPESVFVNNILYYTTGYDCNPLKMVQDVDDICDGIVEGGCKYVQIVSTDGYIGEICENIIDLKIIKDNIYYMCQKNYVYEKRGLDLVK